MTFDVSTPATSLAELTVAAVRAGKTRLIGVGGDGTHHLIVNALANRGVLADVVYAPLSLGSGNDWVRTLRVPSDFPGWLRYLAAYRTRLHGVGRIDFTNTGVSHHFVNVVGFAYDAEVTRIATEERLRRRWMYPLLAAAYLKEYVAPVVQVEYDNQLITRPIHTVNVGLGRNSGGGMSFVPHADPFAGYLALTVVPRQPSWKVLANSWRLYNGSIGRLNAVAMARTQGVTLTPIKGKLECEADGEWLGEGPVRISLLAESLRVVVG